MADHIVLFELQVPADTGNITWACAATNTPLHLIEPLGFPTDGKHLERAGLDYQNDVNITHHRSLTAFLAHVAGKHSHLVTKLTYQMYNEVNYNDGEDRYFLFGREAAGLPETFMRESEEKYIQTPMNSEHVRSLNLPNTTALIVYEALCQQNFPNLELTHHYENDKLD